MFKALHDKYNFIVLSFQSVPRYAVRGTRYTLIKLFFEQLRKKSCCSRIQLNDSQFPECTAVRGTRYTLIKLFFEQRYLCVHGLARKVFAQEYNLMILRFQSVPRYAVRGTLW